MTRFGDNSHRLETGVSAQRWIAPLVIAAAVVWAAIWVATGVVADDALDDMIPILGGGTVFFVILVPAALFRKRS